jgi:hypothetical protein
MNPQQIISEIEFLEASTSIIQEKLAKLKRVLAGNQESSHKKGGLTDEQKAKLLADHRKRQARNNMKLIQKNIKTA